MNVEASNHQRGGIVAVTVAGDIDISTGPAVTEAIDDALNAPGATQVLVDLAEVGFLDSSGITVLLKGRRDADGRSVGYRVTGAHGVVRQVLELTGVWDHLCGGPGDTATTGS